MWINEEEVIKLKDIIFEYLNPNLDTNKCCDMQSCGEITQLSIQSPSSNKTIILTLDTKSHHLIEIRINSSSKSEDGGDNVTESVTLVKSDLGHINSDSIERLCFDYFRTRTWDAHTTNEISDKKKISISDFINSF